MSSRQERTDRYNPARSQATNNSCCLGIPIPNTDRTRNTTATNTGWQIPSRPNPIPSQIRVRSPTQSPIHGPSHIDRSRSHRRTRAHIHSRDCKGRTRFPAARYRNLTSADESHQRCSRDCVWPLSSSSQSALQLLNSSGPHLQNDWLPPSDLMMHSGWLRSRRQTSASHWHWNSLPATPLTPRLDCPRRTRCYSDNRRRSRDSHIHHERTRQDHHRDSCRFQHRDTPRRHRRWHDSHRQHRAKLLRHHRRGNHLRRHRRENLHHRRRDRPHRVARKRAWAQDTAPPSLPTQTAFSRWWIFSF